VPQATIRLVGRRPTASVRRLAEVRGVEVVGQVPDVRPYLTRAAVAVVPLQLARGVQNKVLEALAMAKATIASPQALLGLKAKRGVHLWAAGTAPEWVDAVCRFLQDPGLRQRFGLAGRTYVEKYHRWDQCLEPFAAVLNLPSRGVGQTDAIARTAPGVRTGFMPIHEGLTG
jgi:glycosyltransferase involved in cell wall biosynthesis